MESPLTQRRKRKRRRLRRRGLITLAMLAVCMFVLVRHACVTMAENGHRAIAERITRALTNRDLGPVATMFAPDGGDDVTSDVRLGGFADRLNALGTLREVRVIGPGTSSDSQVFVATFTRGTVREQVSFDHDLVIGFSLLSLDAQR